MSRRPLTPEQRRERARKIGIVVDPVDEWLLSSYTWYADQHNTVRTQIVQDGHVYCIPLAHLIMGLPPDGQNWWRKDRTRWDFRRSNLYLAGFYYTSKKYRQRQEQARERRLFEAVRSAVDLATGDGV